MLTYQQGETYIKVFLQDGKKKRCTGYIKPVEGGFQYFPVGAKTGGKVFPSVAEVKHSLTDDYEGIDQ